MKAISAEQIGLLETKFDIILNFELIEHLFDPSTFIRLLQTSLNKEGLLILTTPNSFGLEILASDYNCTRLLAHSIFPPMHLNAFNTQNILLFAYKNSFKLKFFDTPGKLDLDLISLNRNEIKDKNLKKITYFDENIKAYFQYLTNYLRSSSHMRVVLQK